MTINITFDVYEALTLTAKPLDLQKEDDSLEFEAFNTIEKQKNNLYRDGIEEVIKEKQIDGNRFHEFSKINYVDILKKFYFSFSEHREYFHDWCEIAPV